MSALGRVQAILWATVLVSLGGTSWAFGPVLKTSEALPSKIKTPLGLASRPVEIHNTYISCYDIGNGKPIDCRFVMNINGLAQDGDPLENNGGHTHTEGPPRDLGELRFGGASGTQVNGQTASTQVLVEHLLPQVGGKINTQLDLFVPPGYFTVFPQSFDSSRSFWRFITSLNVKVPGLMELPASPTGVYIKGRRPGPLQDDHKDAVAFSGTGDTLLFLNTIADNFRIQSTSPQRPAGIPLSVNDMSLISGGYFDLNRNWRGERRHVNHRTGHSVDINKNFGDCTQNLTLLAVVDELMPVSSRSPILTRPNAPTHKGSRVLCELDNDKNIHIDFDQIAPIVPLGPF